MTESVQTAVRQAVEELIEKSTSSAAIAKSFKTHSTKVNFMPVKYRVLSRLLQSLNIKFGNFLEKLLDIVTVPTMHCWTILNQTKKPHTSNRCWQRCARTWFHWYRKLQRVVESLMSKFSDASFPRINKKHSAAVQPLRLVLIFNVAGSM